MLARFILFSLVLITSATAAEFTSNDRLQGYRIDESGAWFVFDEAVYNVSPSRVLVEGSFRDWNHDMEDRRWMMKETGQKGIWYLAADDVAMGSVFKFRIDDGKWLEVPATAPNVRGGNLVFGAEYDPPSLTAEIVDARDVRVFLRGKGVSASFDPNRYRLFRAADGIEIPVLNVFYLRPGEIMLYPSEDLDRRRVYYVKEVAYDLSAPASFDGWFRQLYSEKELGANYDARSGKTMFRLFAPRATAVNLYLYKKPGAQYYAKHAMKIDGHGVWEIALKGNLEGIYYDYTVHGFEDPGNKFYETVPVHISDPYARVSVDSFGPGRVWPKVKPPRPLKNGRPAMEDVVAYEVHVQDFTRLLPVEEKKKGTFTAFFERGLKNSRGEAIGFDHLVEMGINVVHLQPVQEFLHFPEKEWVAAFANHPFMKEQGVNLENYQWGYRTTHALAIESRFREKGTEWGAQNQQFRDLIEAFHDHDIAVIVDMVYNHTGERMDGRMDYFNFTVMDQQYYYRNTDKLDFIGEYGTETKSEERPMVQRWIIDQSRNLVEQYGIDGFRIDLAGQTDEQTLRELRRQLPEDLIIYGEPWIASADPDYENNPDWDWYKADSPITFFQDDSRNAFKGSPDNPKDKWQDRGYAGGAGNREQARRGLSAGFPEDQSPLSGINYLDIHDNWALADRFAKTDWDGRKGVDESRVKIAATLLFTSLGPVVIHGGTEFLRSKGYAPLKETEIPFMGKKLYFHGKRDTYNMPLANQYVWENKGTGPDDGMACDYKNMYDYWRGLIALRNSPAGKLFRLAEKPEPGYYRWIEPANPRLLGYMVDQQILVLLNTDSTAGSFNDIELPDGNWQLIANTDQIDWQNGISNEVDSQLPGGTKFSCEVEAAGIRIWLKK
jgi:pullulanase